MQWGSVPAWVAIAISIIAGVHSWWVGRKAAQASAGAASLEVSLQRIADSLAESGRGPIGKSAGAQHTDPSSTESPGFNVEFIAGHSYRLRNVGPKEVTNVAVSAGQFPDGLTRRLPTGVDLSPMAATDPFIIQGTLQNPAPGEVTVTCDQLDGSLILPLPPRS